MTIPLGNLPDSTQNQLIRSALRIASIERYVFGRQASRGDFTRFNKARARACSEALGFRSVNSSDDFRRVLDDLLDQDEQEIVSAGMVLLELGRRLGLTKKDLDDIGTNVKPAQPRQRLVLVEGGRQNKE